MTTPETENSRSMVGLSALAFTYLGALVFAALVAPSVYKGIQNWHTSAPNLLTNEIADNGFDDYFDRLRWLWVLICLPWLIRKLDLKSWSANGFAWSSSDKKACLTYFAVGVLTLCAVASIRLATADFSVEPDFAADFLSIVTKAIMGAVLIGLLEEYVFRTLIWKAFGMWKPVIGGVICASLFFAYTHYKMPNELWNSYEGAINMRAGLFVAWGTLIGFVYDASTLDFVNLILLGIWLSLLRIRTQNLARSIGLHAGIVFALLTYVDMLEIHTTPMRHLFGGPGLRDGLITFLVFSVGIFIERRKCRHNSSSAS